MGVMLATQNPEAAARLSDPRGLPQCSDVVVYHYRPGQIFNGQTKTAAIVLASDRENQTLRLWVVKGLDDCLLLDNVPRKAGDDHGWEYRQPALPVDVLRALSADPPSAPASEPLAAKLDEVVRGLAELTERFDRLGSEMAEVVVGSGERAGERVGDLKRPGLSLYERVMAINDAMNNARKAKRKT